MTQDTALVPAEDNRLSFGQTQLRPEDFIPPRVKVVQQMSQEAADKKAAPGDFYNTLTGETYGPTLRIQPIVPFMQRILLVRREKRELIEDALGSPLPVGDGLMCRSFDMIHGKGSPGGDCGVCPLAQWNEETRKPPLCTETYNVAGMNEIGELVIVSFQKSSAKVGKRVFSMLRMRPGQPWATILELTTRQDKNDLGTFFVPDVTVSKDKPDTAMLSQALTWAQQLRGVVIDVSPEDDGYVPGEDAEPTEAPF